MTGQSWPPAHNQQPEDNSCISDRARQFPIFAFNFDRRGGAGADSVVVNPDSLDDKFLELARRILKEDPDSRDKIICMIPDSRGHRLSADRAQTFFKTGVIIPDTNNEFRGQELLGTEVYFLTVQKLFYPVLSNTQSELFAVRRTVLATRVANIYATHNFFSDRFTSFYQTRYYPSLAIATHEIACKIIQDRNLIQALVDHLSSTIDNTDSSKVADIQLDIVMIALWAFIGRNRITCVVLPAHMNVALFYKICCRIEADVKNPQDIKNPYLRAIFANHKIGNMFIEPRSSVNIHRVDNLQMSPFEQQKNIMTNAGVRSFFRAITLRRPRVKRPFGSDSLNSRFEKILLPKPLSAECIIPFLLPSFKLLLSISYALLEISESNRNNQTLPDDLKFSLHMLTFVIILAIDVLLDIERIMFYFIKQCNKDHYDNISLSISTIHAIIPFAYLGLSSDWAKEEPNSQMPNLCFALFSLIVGLIPIVEVFNKLNNTLVPFFHYVLLKIKYGCNPKKPIYASYPLSQTLKFIITNICIVNAILLLLNIFVNPIYTRGDQLELINRNASKDLHTIANSISASSQTLALAGVLIYICKMLRELKHIDRCAVFGMVGLTLLALVSSSNPLVTLAIDIDIAYSNNVTEAANQTFLLMQTIKPFTITAQWLITIAMVFIIGRLIYRAHEQSFPNKPENNFYDKRTQYHFSSKVREKDGGTATNGQRLTVRPKSPPPLPPWTGKKVIRSTGPNDSETKKYTLSH